jgi:YjbE family integral membrane protein
VGFLFTDLLQAPFWVAALQIIGVNVILSGDNAVVIALACRLLPRRQRFWGMVLGAGVAVVLRIVFTVAVAQAMEYQFLKLIGGTLLLWVAVKMVVPEDSDGDEKVEAAENLWRAVRIVVIADIVMSLDNVIAIAASAETAAQRVDLAHATTIKAALIVFGLTTSIPLIIAGSALLMALLDRYPILVWAGAGLLGWVAGDVMIKDVALTWWLPAELINQLHYWAAAIGAAFVVGAGWLLRRARQRREHAPVILEARRVEFPPQQEESRQKAD